MRLIILVALIYICYRALKSWLGAKATLQSNRMEGAVGAVDDEMIKDPICDVYFPKRNGVHIRQSGKDLYFCSEACRDRYIAAQSESKD